MLNILKSVLLLLINILGQFKKEIVVLLLLHGLLIVCRQPLKNELEDVSITLMLESQYNLFLHTLLFLVVGG